jgi:glycosyltransferase
MLRFSIITACKNSETTIEASLQSLYGQKYKNFEHIVIDGRSVDKTVDLIKMYANQQTKVISEADGGIYDAFNKGLRCATGDVVCFLNSDDYFPDSETLSAVSPYFANTNIQFVYGDANYISRGNGRVVRTWRARDYRDHTLSKGWSPCHTTLFLRRSVYEDLGVFDTDFKISSDYLHTIRLFKNYGHQSCYIPKVLKTMRVGGASTKLSNTFIKWREDYKIVKKEGIGGVGTVLLKNLLKVRQLTILGQRFSK